MKLTNSRAVMYALALSLPACAQFSTSPAERASLKTAADTAAAAYLDCVGREAGRYVDTGGDAQAIGAVARKNCAESRAAAARAQAGLQDSSYILAERQTGSAMQALDDQAQTAVTERVLNRQAAAPAAAAVTAPAASGGTNAYLDCMRSQGERWANVNEPAEVIAQAAQARCANTLPHSGGTEQLERQGRDLIMGLVLDRKAGQ